MKCQRQQKSVETERLQSARAKRSGVRANVVFMFQEFSGFDDSQAEAAGRFRRQFAGDCIEAIQLEEFSSCFMRKLWWLEMVNFIEVLEDIGCFVFGMSRSACPCQFGTDLALIE